MRKSIYYFKWYGVFGFLSFLTFLQSEHGPRDDWGLKTGLIILFLLTFYLVVFVRYEHKHADAEIDKNDFIKITWGGIWLSVLLVAVITVYYFLYKSRADLLSLYFQYVNYIDDITALLKMSVGFLIFLIAEIVLLLKRDELARILRMILYPVVIGGIIFSVVMLRNEFSQLLSHSMAARGYNLGEKMLSNNNLPGCLEATIDHFCYRKYAVITEDVSYCNRISYEDEKNRCLLELVEKTDKKEYCLLSSNRDFAEDCRRQ